MSRGPRAADTGRVRAWLAWSLLVTCVGVVLAVGAFEAFGPRAPRGVEELSANAWVFAVAVVGFALVGALIVTRVTGNPLG